MKQQTKLTPRLFISPPRMNAVPLQIVEVLHRHFSWFCCWIGDWVTGDSPVLVKMSQINKSHHVKETKTELPSRVAQWFYKHGLFLSSYPTCASSLAIFMVLFSWWLSHRMIKCGHFDSFMYFAFNFTAIRCWISRCPARSRPRSFCLMKIKQFPLNHQQFYPVPIIFHPVLVIRHTNNRHFRGQTAIHLFTSNRS